MRKKFIRVMFFGALTMSPLAYTSCADYDDDIEDLRSQVDAIKVSLSELDGLIKAGSVISSVTSASDGVIVKLSDGREFKITNGEKGAAGADGTTWEISEDGYWVRNGKKTDMKAIGLDGKDGKDGTNGKDGQDGTNGKDGQDGKPGADGKPGTNGQYYVPNTESGKFDIYQDGKKVKETDISWRGTGVTAVLDGNRLTFSNLIGADGQATTQTLTLGAELGSLVFVPSAVSSDVPYATTTKPFYHVKSYLDESKFNPTTNEFVPQTSFKKSNIVDFVYRLNPSEAYTEGMVYGFVNRAVTTRATGDHQKELLSVVGTPAVNKGEVTVKAVLDKSKLSVGNNHDIVALQAWQGSENHVTSDNVHVKSTGIDVCIVDSLNYPRLSGKVASGVSSINTDGSRTTGNFYYDRTKKIQGAEETDVFIKKFVSLDAQPNQTFSYTDELDLTTIVGLYSNDLKGYIAKSDFTGMSYEFSVPKEYLANDDKKTNQQKFIESNVADGIVRVDNSFGTSAIGRTPVVRVDAFLNDNNGTKHMVASSYIKLKIAEKATSSKPLGDLPIINIAGEQTIKYQDITPNKSVSDMDWERINKEVYAATGLTSTNFWSRYGGASNTYEVEIGVLNADGVNYTSLLNENLSANSEQTLNVDGIKTRINLNSTNTTTSYVKVSVDNTVKTENTYKNNKYKGAFYRVTIRIKADNNYTNKNVIMQQDFIVYDECHKFLYNPLYHHETYDVDGKKYDNCVVVKGQLDPTTKTWVMSSQVKEHFKNIDGKNIFQYYNTVANVTDIEFAWNENENKDKVTVTPSTVQKNKPFEVALNQAMTKEKEVHNMTYKTTLVNGEHCNYNYNIVFINPFKAGKADGISIFDGIGAKTVNTQPQVLVLDNEGDKIYSWDEKTKTLVLSDKAKNEYKVANLTTEEVTYEFDTTEQSYKDVVENMTSAAKLEVNEKTGVVTWENGGTELKDSHVIHVVVTITFKNLSVVKCNIPVTLTPGKQ